MVSVLGCKFYNWEKNTNFSYLNNMGNTLPYHCCEISNKANLDEYDNPKETKSTSIKLFKVKKEQMLFNSMKHEVNRLNSFKAKWPLCYIKPEDLAKNGFFYLQTEDRVQCAFCQLILNNWRIGDSVLREHIKNYPKCKFLLTSDAGNLPMKKTITGVLKRSFPRELREVNIASSVCKPKQPNMQDIRHRLLTYKSWPFKRLNPQMLAECGLYYEGVADVVTCFYCGGSLGNWELDDDPWQEHKNFFPHCPYLSLAESIGYGLTKHSNAVSQLPVNNIISKSTNLLAPKDPLTSDIISKASEIFSSSAVQNVVLKRLKEQKGAFQSLSELCEEILEFEKNVTTELKSNGYDECGNNSSYTKSIEYSTPEIDMSETINSTVETAYTPESTKDILLCKICMDKERAISFQPCGHFVSCQLCAQRINDCPVCRSPVTSKVRIYMS